jgi:hypothetical protein
VIRALSGDGRTAHVFQPSIATAHLALARPSNTGSSLCPVQFDRMMLPPCGDDRHFGASWLEAFHLMFRIQICFYVVAVLLVSARNIVAQTAAANPLLAKWTGSFGGVPPLDAVKVEHFKPALEAAMAENLAEIDAIANNPAKPDFENTIAAFEGAGRTFDRVSTIFGIFSSTMNSPEFQAVETEMAPKISEFGDKILQNEKLFARIAAVYDARDSLKDRKSVV